MIKIIVNGITLHTKLIKCIKEIISNLYFILIKTCIPIIGHIFVFFHFLLSFLANMIKVSRDWSSSRMAIYFYGIGPPTNTDQ